MNWVLDKIRFMRTYPKVGGYAEYNSHISAMPAHVEEAGFKEMHGHKYQTVFYKPYKGKYEGSGLRLSFGSNGSGTYIAIDCTPYKLTDDEWFDVRGYLTVIFGGPEVIAKKFRLFEVELAADIPYPIDDLVYVVPKLTIENPVALLKKHQHEIGSKQGNRWVRIYDKQKQVKDVKKLKVAHPRTRIEFVHRKLTVTLDKLLSLPNPFGGILAINRQDVRELQKQHPTDYAFAHFARSIANGATGQSAYLDVADSDMRKAIRKRLQPRALNLAGKKSDWDAWIAGELGSLKSKFAPD